MKRSARDIRKSCIRSVSRKPDPEIRAIEGLNPPRLDGSLAIQPAVQLSELIATLAPLQPEDMLDAIPDLITEAVVL